MKTKIWRSVATILWLLTAARSWALSNDVDHDGAPDNLALAGYKISASYDHSCALGGNGVHCWGDNGWDQSAVPTLSNPVAVSAGSFYTCALDDNGMKCWGRDNQFGQKDVPTGLLLSADAFPLDPAESVDNAACRKAVRNIKCS